jgi:hypothetical protein
MFVFCTDISSDSRSLEPESFDVVVSNCVVNLSIDKPAVLGGVLDRRREDSAILAMTDVFNRGDD